MRSVALLSPTASCFAGFRLGSEAVEPSGSRHYDPLSVDPKTWFARVLAAPAIREAPFTPDIAIDSAHLLPPLHGDPADRLLIATARHLGVPIVTRDRQITAYAASSHIQMVAC